MSQWMTATFLGTSSGGGPTESRNCSSLVLDVVGDGSLWSIPFHTYGGYRPTDDTTVVDCAEGTLRQFAFQPQPPKDVGKVLKASHIDKIFVTHMHRESAPQVYSTTVHLEVASQRIMSWAFPPFYAPS